MISVTSFAGTPRPCQVKGNSSPTDCSRHCIPAVFQSKKGARVSQRELGLFFLNSFDFKKTFTNFQSKKKKKKYWNITRHRTKKTKTTTKKIPSRQSRGKTCPLSFGFGCDFRAYALFFVFLLWFLDFQVHQWHMPFFFL